ncbi:flagellar basal body-associated FliL family protein [bacterium]|nr:flagellar basal body-associated FliL family protein [bacterium]
MKKKIQALRKEARFRYQSAKLRFKKLWHDPYEALLFRTLVVTFVSVGSFLTCMAFVFVFSLGGHGGDAQRSIASEGGALEVVDDDAEKVGGGGVPGLGVRAVPKAILNRQDGVQEKDKDLVEPEITRSRGLSSLGEVPKVAPYNPYVIYGGIFGSTAEKSANVGRVAMDVAFEVDSHLVKKELEDREKEISSMISNLVAEQEYEFLRNERGRLFLKKRIFDEVNFKLKKGKVKDVLYSEFIMR